MLWFNTASTQHLNVGYTSSNPSVVAEQVTYLLSRGVDFVIFDWYGTGDSFINGCALLWVAECEKQGLNFAFCFDAGMFAHQPSSVDSTDYMKTQFEYVLTTFGGSLNYERTASGRLLCIEFGWEGKINLATGHTHFDPAFILKSFPQYALCWENAGGYNQPGSSGAFAWVGLNSENTGDCIEAYQADFLAAAGKNSSAITIGSLCKGFDDHNRRPNGNTAQSCWGGVARYADEKQGQTWLNAIAIYNKSTFKPRYLQLVTFNDHEEGTNIEWGIDSQLVCTGAGNSAGVVTFTLAGNVATVDHLEISVDNVVVNKVTNLSAPITFNVNGLEAGTHTIQAVVVGKAFFQQKVSNTLTLIIATTTTYSWK
jgi:hypothetical protein